MSAVADVLNLAADLIERDGWVQGSFTIGSRRCAGQALGDAANLGIPFRAQWDAFNGARQAVLDICSGPTVWQWNDAPGRTQAEVVAALRAAAEHAS